jgi:hypothetical protein
MNSDVIGPLAILGSVAIATWLLFQRWFWMLAFFVGGLASCFSMLASIIYFQIFAAVGFFFLMVICWGIMSMFTDG